MPETGTGAVSVNVALPATGTSGQLSTQVGRAVSIRR